jgi:hypothetical protein
MVDISDSELPDPITPEKLEELLDAGWHIYQFGAARLEPNPDGCSRTYRQEIRIQAPHDKYRMAVRIVG